MWSFATGPAVVALVWILGAPGPAGTWVRVLEVSGPHRLSEREKAAVRQSASTDYREQVRRSLDKLPAEQRELMRPLLEQAPAAQPPTAEDLRRVAEATHYEIVLENTTNDRFARRVRLEVRYLDARGAELGRGGEDVDVVLRPFTPERVRFDCPDDPCIAATALEVVSVAPLVASAYRDRWVRVGDRTWHVVDDWATDGRVSILSFSPGVYAKKPFNPRILAPGTVAIDLSVEGSYDERLYRLLKPVPASEPYPESDIRWMMAAGLVVRDGAPVKQGFFRSLVSGNRILSGVDSVDLPAGEFVRLDAYTERDGDDLGVHLSPVCRPRRGRLNAWLYFRVGKDVLEGGDAEAAEAQMRPWLVPVPWSEVAKVCGPVSGTPVLHLTRASGEADVTRVMGKPEARREAGGASELVYGEMRLRFVGAAFAGVGFGP